MGIAATRILAEPADAGDRRRALRGFLMSRRARLRPADVGLPETRRRRTPGLRREEVAQLAGLSTEWYTLFEMAKDTGVSQRTIDAIAGALRLTPAEHKHLQLLATGVLPDVVPEADVDPTLRAVLDGYNFGPAMLLDVRMNVVAENALAVAVFGDLAAAAGYEGNWLWYLFANHALIDEWEAQARELTATFHASMCEYFTDPEYQELLSRLLESSETFRRFWNEQDVSQLDQVPPLALTHPTYGLLRFTIRVLAQPNANNAFYMCFFVPDEATAQSETFRRLRLDASAALVG
jgi:transcriptional regulator with XRE-family HTH domain